MSSCCNCGEIPWDARGDHVSFASPRCYSFPAIRQRDLMFTDAYNGTLFTFTRRLLFCLSSLRSLLFESLWIRISNPTHFFHLGRKICSLGVARSYWLALLDSRYSQ